jgi:hypothetical protein
LAAIARGLLVLLLPRPVEPPRTGIKELRTKLEARYIRCRRLLLGDPLFPAPMYSIDYQIKVPGTWTLTSLNQVPRVLLGPVVDRRSAIAMDLYFPRVPCHRPFPIQLRCGINGTARALFHPCGCVRTSIRCAITGSAALRDHVRQTADSTTGRQRTPCVRSQLESAAAHAHATPKWAPSMKFYHRSKHFKAQCSPFSPCTNTW